MVEPEATRHHYIMYTCNERQQASQEVVDPRASLLIWAVWGHLLISLKSYQTRKCADSGKFFGYAPPGIAQTLLEIHAIVKWSKILLGGWTVTDCFYACTELSCFSTTAKVDTNKNSRSMRKCVSVNIIQVCSLASKVIKTVTTSNKT